MAASTTPELPTEPILRLEPGTHWAPIRRIDVDAAGRFVVSGSHDKTVRVWSLADGQLLRTLRIPLGEGNVGKVYAVAITPDGERIAAGGWLRESPDSIYVFERASGRIVARVDGLPNVINHLTFSPDGRHLVACLGGANGIRIYETGAFREIASDRDYGAMSCWAAFDRAGRLVTTSYDGKSGSTIRASGSAIRKRRRAASGRWGSPSRPTARGSRSATATARGSCWMAKLSRRC
jgi:WD40 repeat protein